MKFLTKYKEQLVLAIVIAAGVFISLPLFEAGWFPMHDDAQIARVIQMQKALQAGHVPARWAPDLGYGYGYPLFNFYAPLPYYIGGLLTVLGLSPLIATKTMIALGLILSGLAMYILAKKLFGVWGGALSAVVYLYAPYHATDIYVRGAIGELYAFVFLPLIVYGFIRILESKKHSRSGVVILALSYAGVVLSHNISAFVTSLFIALLIGVFGLWHLYKSKLTKRFLYQSTQLVAAILLGLGLSAFFWLPAVTEQSYTNVEKVISGGSQYAQHFLYIDQLWDSPWGFAGSSEGRADGMSFKIGKLHVLLGIAGLASLLFMWYRQKLSPGKKLLTIAFFLILVVSVFMTLEHSKSVWDSFSYLAFIQFPWRFLVWILFAVSIFAGALVLSIPKKFQALTAIGICLAVILVNEKYFVPQQYVALPESEYTSEEYTKWYVSKQSDEYMPPYFPIPESEDEIVVDRFRLASFDELSIEGDDYYQVVTFSVSENTTLTANIAVYPVWKFELNGHSITPNVKNSVYTVPIEKGADQTLTIQYVATSYGYLANIITITSILILSGTIIGISKYIWQRKKQ